MTVITHEFSLNNFYKQIDYVLDTYKNHNKKASQYNNIIIGGLGGSGIGGRLARLVFFLSTPIPIEVFSEYKLPGYANHKTLLILCSYSGNTEETLSMFEDARLKKCDIICVAAGGRLKELAIENSLTYYGVEPGYQPRMTLGYSFSTLLMILGEIADMDFRKPLEMSSAMLKNNTNIKLIAGHMFELFKPTIREKFVVVCDLPFEAAAMRFCQQIQENAKGEGFVSVLPEGNHNMIESYYEKLNTNFIFLNSKINARVTARFEFLKNLLEEKGNVIFEYPVESFGLNTLFEVIHATDWLSIYASNEKKADNMKVDIIMKLKGHLENIT